MNIPNFLSVVRLALVPVFAIVFHSGAQYAYTIAAVIFLAAEITDILDGYIARKYNQITRLGRVLDPLADKLMKATAMVCLSVVHIVPVWAVVALFAKELTILFGTIALYRRVKDVPGSNIFGKAAEFSICAMIVAEIFFEIARPLATILWIAVMAMEFAAMTIYIVRAVQSTNQIKEEAHEN